MIPDVCFYVRIKFQFNWSSIRQFDTSQNLLYKNYIFFPDWFRIIFPYDFWILCLAWNPYFFFGDIYVNIFLINFYKDFIC
jgi:hypothetical protein